MVRVMIMIEAEVAMMYNPASDRAEHVRLVHYFVG